MPNFLCGSLVVVRCGPQGLSVLFDRPGARTAVVAAGYSYLLMATDARSTSRDRLRAMPCQKEENERSEVKSAKTIRMSRFAANDSRLAKKAFKKMRTKSASGGDGLFTNPRIVARSQR